MNRYFEYRQGQFVSVSEITQINTELVDCQKSRDVSCVRVRAGIEKYPFAESIPFNSWEEAYKLSCRLVSLITDDETKVISLPEFWHY